MPLEYATALAMVAFACADLLGAPRRWMLAAALAAAAVHAWRFARWRGWRTASEPLLWSIHLGYAWLIAALLLRAAAELLPQVPREAWIHAFMIGAYGMLKIGLHDARRAAAHRPAAAGFEPACRRPSSWCSRRRCCGCATRCTGLGEWALAGVGAAVGGGVPDLSRRCTARCCWRRACRATSTHE